MTEEANSLFFDSEISLILVNVAENKSYPLKLKIGGLIYDYTYETGSDAPQEKHFEKLNTYLGKVLHVLTVDSGGVLIGTAKYMIDGLECKNPCQLYLTEIHEPEEMNLSLKICIDHSEAIQSERYISKDGTDGQD